MPKLDSAIDRLYHEAGLELVFQTGAIPFVRMHTGMKQILKAPLSTAQIVAAIGEIIPAGLRATFPKDGTTRFPYRVGERSVQVRFDKWAERVRASLVPAPTGSEESEAGSLSLISDAPWTDPAKDAVGPSMPIPRHHPAYSGPPPEEPKPEPAKVLTVIQVTPAPEPPKLHAPAVEAAKEMASLLELMLERRASDLHLTSGKPPVFRIDGDMVPEPGYPAVTPERMKELLGSIAPAKNREQFEAQKDSDFAHETEKARFRVNLFADRRGPGAVLRQIPNQIKTAQELGLTPAILELCNLSKGLVLVTGPTGSGKSTTLAAMIDHINRTRNDHIITIEDPIEFVHPDHKCLVNQREVGVHTGSFKNALRAALREDPDIVLVGELRDLETIAIAIETAETGHLVFGTLHTNTAPSTVDRIIDQFPADRQAQVRTMLSESLKGVVSQTLCKKIGGGRAAAQEILICNNSVSNLIREGKTYQIASSMQTGKALGMQTLNDALLELVRKNVVAPEEALKKAVAKAELRAAIERAGFKFGDEKAAPAKVAA